MSAEAAVQGSPEWFAARLGIPTASTFADMMATVKTGEAASRRNLRTKLVIERLTGARAETFTSFAMQQGAEREPAGRVEYEVRFNTIVREVGFIRHQTIACGASPDGLIEDDGGFELKCPLPSTHFAYLALKAGECPSEYRWQVQGSMWVTGRKWWDFCSYCPEFPPELQLIRRRVMRNDIDCAALRHEVEKFLAEIERDEMTAREYREPQ